MLQVAARQAQALTLNETLGRPGSSQQFRFLGGEKVPEFWGKPSIYTPDGPEFLGVPPDHLEKTKERPLSPDVFEIDQPTMHYKFPLGAITSILNRVTGVMLTAGFTGAGYVALTGDLPGAITALATDHPMLAFPAKLVVSWPLIYHYLGGIRHVVWDNAKMGNQTDHSDLLETPKVELSSKVLIASSVVLALIAAAV